MIPRIRAGLALSGAVAVTAILAPAQFVCMRFGLPPHRKLPMLWHRALARLFGFRIHVHGEMERRRPLLIVANHISWSDIIVLGALDYVSFIAKAEMTTQPLLGSIARLQNSVFVERENRTKARQQAAEIADRLAGGDAMVLFAEGSTADGNSIGPFKSSLLGAAEMAARQSEGNRVLVQPVSIAYVRLHGMPMGRRYRNVAAWVGDTSMYSHFMKVLREGSIDVEIRYGEPAELVASSDRKEVTRLMEARVRELMAHSLRSGIAEESRRG
jgi:1-acyl-sn-glycerol-3-phosphate acyltransferase